MIGCDMPDAATDGYAAIVAQAVATQRIALSARWLARLNEILEVDARRVFPSEQLLDHIPLLIAEVAAYLRAPQAEEISANAAVIDKARELGLLRHEQQASVHQLLREYEILGEILEAFMVAETDRLELRPEPFECFECFGRLTRAIRTLMRTTVDTFVGEYTATLQERNERIDKFNKLASHELRTPIGVLTFAATLLNTDLVQSDPSRLMQVATVIRNNVDRLAWLIDNLQRLARIDLPLDVPSHQRVEVASIAVDVSRQLEEMAAARDVTIHVQPTLPVVYMDPARLELILLNLLSNAIKYSDPDKPHRSVRVEGETHLGERGDWTLRVSDNGLGIPASAKDAIFERFFRAHQGLDAKLGISGSGLGLAIVAECAAASNASIVCHSEPGVGTEFLVTFADVRPPHPPPTAEPQA